LDSRAVFEANAIDGERSGQIQTVDILRRLAGDEAAVLPEIFAGAGAAAAVQAMDDVGSDATGF
jgi:hypothetical protein